MSIEDKLIPNQSLASYSTFGIGGPAKFFVEIKTPEEMAEARRFINREKLPFWIIGRGSNSLFDDRGFNGLVILSSIRFCDFKEGKLVVGSGYNFSLLGTQMARQGYSGLEFAAGIPGSVGGAIFMNAGANGFETCDVLTEVSYVDPEGTLCSKKRSELEFSYRHSSFHENRGIIVSGTFTLQKCKDARKKQVEITRYRIATQPYGQPSAGCVFRNPSKEKTAGLLIESCGLKGKRVGDAEVSTVHANFIINRGKATAQEVLELATQVRQTVSQKAGILLEMEMRLVPYEKGNA
ncbi:MAG: UDP-N-acetylmuramate dehydrogenase [Simkania sp.]|nr:UDP-N-acetylmuramate dehydrogenase [Simkania sp.]